MKIAGFRWYIICLVAIGTMLNALGRSSLSVAAPTLFQELHINEQQYSWIIGAFQAAYTISQPLCGYMLDVVGLRTGFLIMIVAWSLSNIAHALVPNWFSLAMLRGLIGLSEGATIPAGAKCSAEWFPARERGLAGAIASIGPAIGAIAAPLLVLWAVRNYSWDIAFVVIGCIGLVFAVLWWFLFDPPHESRFLQPDEAAYIHAGQESHLAGDSRRPTLRTILSQRNFWGIALPRFLADPTWGTINFWFPLYLMAVRGMSLAELAMLVWLPYVAGDFGSLFGGMLNRFVMRYTRLSTINARRIGFTLGAVLMLPLALVGYVESPYTAIAIVSLCFFAHQLLVTQVIVMSTDLFRRNEVSTACGLAGMTGWSGIFICTLIMGALVRTVGYSPFFVILSILDIFGAIILWTLVREGPRSADQSRR